MKDMISQMESLEDTLCDMYAKKLGKDKAEIKSSYFDGIDHWLTAEEAKSFGFIDGIYDADPVPEESTPEQIYAIFNNRLNEPQNILDMNLEELKKRPQFNDCVTDAEVLARLGQIEAKADKVNALESENNSLKAQLKSFKDAVEEEAAVARKTLLDAAEQDGRINAETRPVYENLLKEHPEDGKKALASLPAKKMVKDVLPGDQPTEESPWERRQREIRNQYHGK